MVGVTKVVDRVLGGDFGVDANQVPVGWHWNILRATFFDDGSVAETHLRVPFTDADLAKHVSTALVAQAADIAADAAKRDELAEHNEQLMCERNAAITERDEALSERDEAFSAVAKMLSRGDKQE